MKTIFFDIETGPMAEAELAAMVPPFDPAEVKMGNLKDPEKIAAKLAEAEAGHQREFIERAALDPLTGRVVAIGLLFENSEFAVIGHDDEAVTLREFWDACRGEMGRINRMIGFNTHLFDLPFLIRRSFKHRVEVPFGIRRGRYWSDEMIDLRNEWQLGDRQARGSLDSIAKHLGLGGKCVAVASPLTNGPLAGKHVTGADFARFWESDRESALAYLRNDVELTGRIAESLGVVEPLVAAY